MKTAYPILALLLCTAVAYSCRKDDGKTVARPATNDSTYVDNDSTEKLKEVIQENYMWLYERRVQEVYHLTFDDTTRNEADTTSEIFALQMLNPVNIQLPSGRVAIYHRTVDSLIEYRYQSPEGNAWLRVKQVQRMYLAIDIYDTVTTTTQSKTTIAADHYWVGY